MRLLRRAFALVGGLLALALVVGVILPGEWSVERAVRVEAPPDSVHAVLSRPAAWSAWMPWPESGARFEGPDRGPGAAFAWDDPTYGAGRLTLLESEPPRRLTYRVSVEDGAIRVDGAVRLEASDGGTRIHWRESGDFGWNPLLGYAALTMEERQGGALEEALVRLKAHLEAGAS